jgi:hypothetical protein
LKSVCRCLAAKKSLVALYILNVEVYLVVFFAAALLVVVPRLARVASTPLKSLVLKTYSLMSAFIFASTLAFLSALLNHAVLSVVRFVR